MRAPAWLCMGLTAGIEFVTGSPILRNSSSEIAPSDDTSYIPVTTMGCPGGLKFDPEDGRAAAQMMIDYSNQGKVIWPHDVHWTIANTSAVWICNCKEWWKDHVPKEEMDEAMFFIEHHCGLGNAGWIWSEKWQKGYNLAHSDDWLVTSRYMVCPINCVH